MTGTNTPHPTRRKSPVSTLFSATLALAAIASLSTSADAQAFGVVPQNSPLSARLLNRVSARAALPVRPMQTLRVRFKTGTEPVAFARHYSLQKAQTLAAQGEADAAAPALSYVRSNRAIGWHVFKASSPEALQATIADLRRNPDVEAIEPCSRLKLAGAPIPPPNDFYWAQEDWQHLIVVLAGLDTDRDSARLDDSAYWTYTWSLERINALAAWDVYPHYYYTAAIRKKLLSLLPSKLPLIGVIDTGIDFTHPDFSYTGNPSHGTADTNVVNGGQINTALSRSFVSGNTDPDPMLAADEIGHGTSVAGLIGAAANNKLPHAAADDDRSGIPGIGFPSQLVALKVLDASGNGDDSDLNDALTYAADKHLVAVNVSLNLDTTVYPQALQDAVNYCWSKGTLVIAAAGNDGDPAHPLNGQTRRYPASLDHVLAVAATTYSNDDTTTGEGLASYSNYGYELGVAAPGGDVTTFSNSAANGQEIGLDPIQEYVLIWTLAPTYQVVLSDPNSADGTYAALGLYGLNYGAVPGTSFAAPHVTGLAALYAAEMNLKGIAGSPQRIVNAIERGAMQMNGRKDGGFDPNFGWGRIDAQQTVLNANARNATVGGIMGQVTIDNAPFQNIPVYAQQIGGKKYSAATYADGLYHFINLPAGNYIVTTSFLGKSGTISAKITAGCDLMGVSFKLKTH